MKKQMIENFAELIGYYETNLWKNTKKLKNLMINGFTF